MSVKNSTVLDSMPIWKEFGYDPRNQIGHLVIEDERRSKQIESCRIGSMFSRMENDHLYLITIV